MTRLPPDAESALHEGRQAYVAVEASSGPHVTPELFAYSGGRLWFASAVSTVKARVLSRTHLGAVAVAVPGRVVTMQGPVECFDPRRPIALLAAAARGPAAARALIRYGSRNAADLLAFGSDLGRGRLGVGLPPLRALFALDPASGVIVERGAVVDCWGRWTSDPLPIASAIRPDGIQVVAAAPGPVALPVSWFPAESELHLQAGLAARLPAASRFPVSFAVDEYNAPGPDAKAGVLLRGVAHVSCDPSQLMVELDRLVQWDGVETSTTNVGS